MPRFPKISLSRVLQCLAVLLLLAVVVFCLVYYLGPRTTAAWHINHGNLRPLDASKIQSICFFPPGQEGDAVPLSEKERETFLTLMDGLYLEDDRWTAHTSSATWAPGEEPAAEFRVDFADSSRLSLSFNGQWISFGTQGSEGWLLDYTLPDGSVLTDVTNPVRNFYLQLAETRQQ